MFEQSVQVLDESMVDPDLTVENNKPRQNGLSQSSILDAIKTAVQSEDPLSPQTLIDLDGEFSFTEVLSEASEDEGASDLNFMERFENAVNSSDFGFARQLLGFAKEGEIDLPSYHYHRLRLCEAMNDEDAFYDYYCEVEQLVPSFDTDLQTKISQLVLKMAQN